VWPWQDHDVGSFEVDDAVKNTKELMTAVFHDGITHPYRCYADCACVKAHVHACVCMHAWVRAHVCAHTRVCACVSCTCACACACPCACPCPCPCPCPCLRPCPCPCPCSCAYVSVCYMYIEVVPVHTLSSAARYFLARTPAKAMGLCVIDKIFERKLLWDSFLRSSESGQLDCAIILLSGR